MIHVQKVQSLEEIVDVIEKNNIHDKIKNDTIPLEPDTSYL